MEKIKWTNEKRKLSELVPWPRNPRQINEEQAKKLSESLDAFDQVETIAIGPENEIYNGHQRLNVWAGEHGPDFEVDVRVSSRKLSEKEREKLTIYLHKGAAGEWDFDILANEFEVLDLLDWGFDEKELQVAGFDFGDPEEAPEAQIDKAAELQEKWQVERGQIWEIGNHRLMCGDSTSEEDVGRLMGGVKAQLVWTDPPYGVSYGDKLEAANPMGYRVRTIENDDLPADQLEEFLRTALKNAADNCIEGASIYVASPPGTPLPALIASFAGSGFRYRWGLIWLKDQIVLSRADYHFKHENILFGWKPGAAHYFVNDRTQASVFEYPRPKKSDEHPTMKPPDLIAHMIRNSSRKGDIVVDLFLGSGSTMVASEKISRSCYAVELEPKYCAVTLERMSDMGLEPRLLNNG